MVLLVYINQVTLVNALVVPNITIPNVYIIPCGRPSGAYWYRDHRLDLADASGTRLGVMLARALRPAVGVA